MSTDRFDELTRARDGVLAEAEGFRRVLAPALHSSLLTGAERLRSEQASLLVDLGEDGRRALEAALEGAARAGVSAVLRRLEDPEVWLSPLTAPDLHPPSEGAPAYAVPSWLGGALVRRRSGLALGALDDPANRVWVAIGSAAGSVDPVLQEFGFVEAPRRIGAGRFGVVPRTLSRLDPSGVLRQRWKRYRAAYERYEALARVMG